MVDKILRKARDLGVKQAELARVAAVAPARITDWKTDDWEPSIGQLLRISRRLGLSLDYLTDESADVPPASIGPDDLAILATVRALNLDLDDVLRALHRLDREFSEQSPDVHTHIATQSMTESDIRRDQEAALANQANPQNKGANSFGRPTGKR